MDAPANERARQHPRFSLPAVRPSGSSRSFSFPPVHYPLLLSLSLSLSHARSFSRFLHYSIPLTIVDFTMRHSFLSSLHNCMKCSDQSVVEILYSRYLYAFISFSFSSKQVLICIHIVFLFFDTLFVRSITSI